MITRKRSLHKTITRTLAVGIAAMLAGCGTAQSTGGTAQSTGGGSGELSLQSLFTGAEEDGINALADSFSDLNDVSVTVNTIPTEDFRAQLPTYLSSPTPPDVLTWFAGKSTRVFADQGAVLDVSDVWENHLQGYPEALKKLSTDSSGKQVFIPMKYYWWGVYYKKSQFAELGVEVPTTWDEFLDVAAKIDAQGVTPLGIGLADNPWLASAWFDYLNLRINGGQFHLDLLAGKHSFEDPRVVEVMDYFAEILPYFDENALGVSWNQDQANFAQGSTAMTLTGAFFQGMVPDDVRDDLGFFQFPIIDPSVPVVEEAPVDGFIASAGGKNPEKAKELLAYLASAEAQELLLASQGGTALAANPEAKAPEDDLAKQGKEMIESASQLTQFFNRDAGEALQPTADAALTEFFSKPDKVRDILKSWQTAAERAR